MAEKNLPDVEALPGIVVTFGRSFDAEMRPGWSRT
jgi:hypothetical protein